MFTEGAIYNILGATRLFKVLSYLKVIYVSCLHFQRKFVPCIEKTPL